MELVEQHRRVALQRRVRSQHPGKHPFGDHLNARRRAHPGVQPGAVAHGLPYRFTELLRHEPGHRPRRHPARLQNQNTVVAAPGRVQQHQRHAGGLAGAGRRLQHGAALLGQTAAQLRQHGVHRQSKISGFSHGGILSEMMFRAGVSPAGSRVCVLPFRERREPVPGGSLSNVLFSRVPEGQNTDPLLGKFRRHGS